MNKSPQYNQQSKSEISLKHVFTIQNMESDHHSIYIWK